MEFSPPQRKFRPSNEAFAMIECGIGGGVVSEIVCTKKTYI